MCRYGGAELQAVAAFIGKANWCLSRTKLDFFFNDDYIFITINLLFLCSPGGCAAQEAIKIITKQYVPLDNTFIYNAITATTATLRV